MRDAVGSTLLLYIVIIVLGVVGSIIVATNTYSRAYKAKNVIINSIDENYIANNENCFENNGDADASFACHDLTELFNTNYNSLNIEFDCKDTYLEHFKNLYNVDECTDGSQTNCIRRIYPDPNPDPDLDNDENLGVCIYKIENFSNNSYSYAVVTFNHLTISLFGSHTLFKTPVYGETRIYYNKKK